jgi:triosephosphate isomerase
MTRIPFLAGNWKMFKTGGEAAQFIDELAPLVDPLIDREVALAVPATALEAAAKAAAGSRIVIGAQNIHWEREGAFTGEVSAPMVKAAGAAMVLIGHSERRQLFGEDDAQVGRKIAAALAERLLPVICVGENLSDREKGLTMEVLTGQTAPLASIPAADAPGIVLAYEPVWAIGTGKAATVGEAQEVHVFLRRRLREFFGSDTAGKARILYGGSVKPDNAPSLLAQPDIDGLLVGGASLKVDSFAKIVAGVPAKQ